MNDSQALKHLGLLGINRVQKKSLRLLFLYDKLKEERGDTMNKLILEVCCNSVEDCIVSQEGGAHRIELNSAVHLGGLTPTVETLKLAKAYVSIPIVVMIRPRGGGFHYDELEIQLMKREAVALLKAGADGVVFGFLNEDKTIDVKTTEEFVEIAHHYHKEAIFHRAIDVTDDINTSMMQLIDCKVDRVLTSGGHANSEAGMDVLKELQQRYGNQIEICAGAGINETNARSIYDQTQISQLHGSFKTWFQDPTTSSSEVSYAYSENGSYEGVSISVLRDVLSTLSDK